jgi:thiol-disulfide isomerase/thioredoxin
MLSLPAALVALAITGAGSGQTVLLDFYSDSCGPCRQMMPTVDQLMAEGMPVQRVNVTQNPGLAQRFGVSGIPCFVMVVNGREAGRVVGATSLGRLEQLCSLGRPAPAANTMVAQAAPQLPIQQPAANQFPATQPAGPSVPVVPISYSAPANRAPISDADMLAASVRLRVEDPQGHSCGSGTIIDALPGGEALVLTCGHLFRDSQGQGKVEVDVFGPAPATHVPGRVISYDLDRDVALVAFRPQGAVTVARVAPRGYPIQRGNEVTSVGCDQGADPTVQHSRINDVDKVLDAVEQRLGHKIQEPHSPWNVDIAGQPVVGRSGGGLFSADGEVIGVCNAAVPDTAEGLYAALGSIHAALDQQHLSSLYQQPIAPPMLVRAPADARQPAANDPFASGRNTAPSGPSSNAAAGAIAAHTSNPAPAGMSDAEQATLNELHRKLREGYEIDCIVRDRNDPHAHSQMFTLDEASPIFVNQLSRAAQPAVRHETSMNRRAPIVEWDAEKGFINQNGLPK